ncbi:MAG: D-alanine--D-alanine ligase [Clostridiaceae bacterium]|nr:D-alanine--D-alanine ligase [Clostridiaceae bacterium]
MKIKVGVFFGGRSVEHEVSVISALQAIDSINKEKYSIIPVYIAKTGIWYTGDELLDIENFKDIDKLLLNSKKLMIENDGNERIMVKYPLSKFAKNILGSLDVAFPVIHGTNGEDGTLQGYFESIDLPYVGCDVLSSAVGMDKVFAKKLLKDAGIPVVECVWFYSVEWLKDKESIIAEIEAKIKYPLIVKPANTGSSVGVKRVNNRFELEDAVDLARSFSRKIMAEVMVVDLREINCSVLGDYEKAEASVCEEPISSKDILTYQDKYMSNGSKGSGSKGMSGASRQIPALITEEMTKEIQRLALESFRTIGCAGVCRIDFLIDRETAKVYVNELNTIPGSLAFYLWEATGKKYSQLTEELIKLALKKDREKQELMFTFDSNILAMQGGIKGSKGIK